MPAASTEVIDVLCWPPGALAAAHPPSPAGGPTRSNPFRLHHGRDTLRLI